MNHASVEVVRNTNDVVEENNVETPAKQHNRPRGTACCSASNGMIPYN